MKYHFIEYMLGLGILLAALAVAAVGTLGFIVWLSGGRSDQTPGRKRV